MGDSSFPQKEKNATLLTPALPSHAQPRQQHQTKLSSPSSVTGAPQWNHDSPHFCKCPLRCHVKRTQQCQTRNTCPALSDLSLTFSKTNYFTTTTTAHSAVLTWASHQGQSHCRCRGLDAESPTAQSQQPSGQRPWEGQGQPLSGHPNREWGPAQHTHR